MFQPLDELESLDGDESSILGVYYASVPNQDDLPPK